MKTLSCLFYILVLPMFSLIAPQTVISILSTLTMLVVVWQKAKESDNQHYKIYNRNVFGYF